MMTTTAGPSVEDVGAPPNPWARDARDVARDLGTDVDTGLGVVEARERLARGANELEPARRRSMLAVIWAQFANSVVGVLMGAAVVTVIIRDLRDTVVIAAVLIVNGTVGYIQDRRGEHAVEALRRLDAPYASVVRDGRVGRVAAAEIVPGDILRLEAGDVVPADGRLAEAAQLVVNEAILTGESLPVDKAVAPLAGSLPLAERANMVYRGTIVARGRGVAVVTATGMATEMGRVAGLLRGPTPPTPLQRRLATLGRQLAVGVTVISALVFVVGLVRGEPAGTMLLAAASLAVAAIPESLPAVVTVTLAVGAQRMAARHAVARTLLAVETLGSVTVIATDKTGTITEGRIVADRLWTARGEAAAATGHIASDGRAWPDGGVDVDRLLVAAALCNDATIVAVEGAPHQVVGDPTEAALLATVAAAGLDGEAIRRSFPRLDEIPFDSGRRRMTTVHRAADGGFLVATKGALESVLPLATKLATPGGDVALDEAGRALVLAAHRTYASQGARVLALAARRVAELPEDVEAELVLLGLAVLRDPPRPAAAAALAVAHEAGILLIVVTGDHPDTAAAIAREVGLGDVPAVVTGDELEALDLEAVGELLEHTSVCARTTSEQKLTIVEALRARGHIVAMTGDGVNDAPALKRADVGVAMGIGGTEVAKEAADLVLADDELGTIVAAVEEGRRIHDNIRRFLRYSMIGGAAEIWVMLIGPFVGLPLPLLPVQILWVNLITHGLPGLALALEPAESDVMRRPPRDPGQRVLGGGLWQHVAGYGILTGSVCLGFGVWAKHRGAPWQTLIFLSLTLLQLANAVAIRSEHDAARHRRFRANPFLAWVLAGSVVLQLATVAVPPLRSLLQLDMVSGPLLLAMLAISSICFWAMEGEKALRRRARARLFTRESLGTLPQPGSSEAATSRAAR